MTYTPSEACPAYLFACGCPYRQMKKLTLPGKVLIVQWSHYSKSSQKAYLRAFLTKMGKEHPWNKGLFE